MEPILEDVILAIEQMDIQKCKMLFAKHELPFYNYKMLYGISFIFDSFAVLEALGNTNLKLSKRHYKTRKNLVLYEGDEKILIYGCKFVGNYTKHYIYLFMEVLDGCVINWYDCLAINKQQGSIPICAFQIVCYDETLGFSN